MILRAQACLVCLVYLIFISAGVQQIPGLDCLAKTALRRDEVTLVPDRTEPRVETCQLLVCLPLPPQRA